VRVLAGLVWENNGRMGGRTVGRKSRRAHDEPFRIRVSAPDLSRLACDLVRRAGRLQSREPPRNQGHGVSSRNRTEQSRYSQTAQIRRGHASNKSYIVGAPRFSPYHSPIVFTRQILKNSYCLLPLYQGTVDSFACIS